MAQDKMTWTELEKHFERVRLAVRGIADAETNNALTQLSTAIAEIRHVNNTLMDIEEFGFGGERKTQIKFELMNRLLHEVGGISPDICITQIKNGSTGDVRVWRG